MAFCFQALCASIQTTGVNVQVCRGQTSFHVESLSLEKSSKITSISSPFPSNKSNPVMPCYFWLLWPCWVDVWTWVGFVPAYSVLLCRLAFPFPFLTPDDGVLAQQLLILCGCVGARASRTRVSPTPTLTWDSAAAIFLFPYVCFLNILGMKVSFQVMAESQPFGFQPCLLHYPFLSLMNWVTALIVEGSCRARHQHGTMFWICWIG